MVLRLKSVVSDIVGDFQNAFVQGRLLVDNCLLAHEMMNFVKKRKKGIEFMGILKIDFNKVYDRIRWDFVEKVLRAYKFPKFWIGWIMQCTSSVTYSILVNGEPSESFKPNCGLRQEDPLSRISSFYVWRSCQKNDRFARQWRN